MFESVLVANRGEIAVRICKTLRRMGIRSVVVASIPDRRSLAVRTADDWVLLEGYSAAETYLDIDAVIAAAKEKGCQAIHPGYGFLSERADFAERCTAEGIVFIGPRPDVLRALGDKSAARRLAVENGVPVVPGWDGADDDDTLIHEATRIGFPVMVKARGGGGGRGMRPVHDPHEMAEALESARREALAAFGDPGLLVEKLVTNAHHVEVQVVADAHGNYLHLGERDCSVQRRRQKLIEETPSPVVDEALRAELTGAALKLARAVSYLNAGTFEFLVGQPAADGRRPFYFLEVNPRLQVEHPVTEMVTGLDLVEWQLRVAAGEELPLQQEDVRFEGHAIEFRINAEDPWDGFQPSSGRIADWVVGLYAAQPDQRFETAREDSGYEEGDVIPSHYDSLVAKRIVSGATRAEALSRASVALNAPIRGVATNLDLHSEILCSPSFVDGTTGVDWLERELDALLMRSAPPDEWWAAAGHGVVRLRARFVPLSRSTPLTRSAGWLGAGDVTLWLGSGPHRRVVALRDHSGSGERLARVDGRSVHCTITATDADSLTVRHGPVALDVSIEMFNEYGCTVRSDDRTEQFEILPPPPLPRRVHDAAEGATAVVAPLAGTIAAVSVEVGDEVEAGELLLTLDAMKMEHRITATVAGMVTSVRVAPGDVVREGDLLVELG